MANANELCDWRIYFEFVQRLIVKARALYASEDFGEELANAVYALDATTNPKSRDTTGIPCPALTRLTASSLNSAIYSCVGILNGYSLQFVILSA